MTRSQTLLALSALLALGWLPRQLPAQVDRPAANPAVTANNDLAFDLYDQLARQKVGENFFFSPYSISNAMLMATEGARGETAEEMGKVLRFPRSVKRDGADAADRPWDTEPLHLGTVVLNKRYDAANQPAPKELQDKIAALRKDLAEANKELSKNPFSKAGTKARQLAAEINKLQGQLNPFELRVANSLWAEKTYPFKKSYLDTINKHYGVVAMPVDFVREHEAIRKRINGWVEERTRDRIKDLIPPKAIDDSTRLVIANAIYFKGDWAEPFKEDQTKPQPFTLANGTRSDVSTMAGLKSNARYAAFNADGTFFDTPTRVGFDKQDPKSLYPAADGFEMVELPYQGGELAMVVIAPRSATGLAELEKTLASKLPTLLGNLRSRNVEVYLPKFKLDVPFNAKKAFEALGMKRAFTDPRRKDGAQFEGLSDAKSAMEKLYISQVLHKAFVEVNEKGTEAAAATAVIFAQPTSAPVTRPFTPTFEAKRPFVFLIRDQKSGAVLFLGRITNPKAS